MLGEAPDHHLLRKPREMDRRRIAAAESEIRARSRDRRRHRCCFAWVEQSPHRCGGRLPVDREGPVPASAAAPNGDSSSCTRASRERSRSRPYPLDIGQQVMAERDGLCGLQVRVAGHDRSRVALSLVERADCKSLNLRPARATAPFSQSRKSVATWSLRERAVCSRLPPCRSARPIVPRHSCECP